MTNQETKSKVMALGNKLAARGQDRSAAFKKAWNTVFFDSLDFVMTGRQVITRAPQNQLVLDMGIATDRGKLGGMIEHEIRTGCSYSYSVRL